VTASTGGRPARSGTRLAGTIFGITMWVIVTGGGGALFFLSVQEHGDAARSSYTQAHGVRQTVRVISERTSPGDDPKHPTSALAVRLNRPVNGHDTTTVHIQGAPAYSPGAPVTVVVDPQDPGYAELPGGPYSSSADWKIPLVLGLACILVFPFGVGVAVLRSLRSRRRLRRTLLR
jgi:hypothetical protein